MPQGWLLCPCPHAQRSGRTLCMAHGGSQGCSSHPGVCVGGFGVSPSVQELWGSQRLENKWGPQFGDPGGSPPSSVPCPEGQPTRDQPVPQRGDNQQCKGGCGLALFFLLGVECKAPLETPTFGDIYHVTGTAWGRETPQGRCPRGSCTSNHRLPPDVPQPRGSNTPQTWRCITAVG